MSFGEDWRPQWWGRTAQELKTSEIVKLLVSDDTIYKDHLEEELDKRLPIPCICNPMMKYVYESGEAVCEPQITHRDHCPARFR